MAKRGIASIFLAVLFAVCTVLMLLQGVISVKAGNVGTGSNATVSSSSDASSELSDGQVIDDVSVRRSPLRLGAGPVSYGSGSDGSSFVTSVTYKSDGHELQPNANGSYTVELGKDYEVDLEFTESEDNQFPNDQLVYHLPAGINPVATGGEFSIDFSIVATSSDVVQETLSGNHYTITSDGTITVDWNTAGDAYSAFEDCGNVSFTLNFSGSFDGTSTELTFSDEVTTTITVDDSSDITVEKSGTYNPATNKVEYTAIVTGNKGTNTNVVVTDTLSGTALTLDTDSISISKTPDTAAEPTQQSVSEDGFVYNISTVNAGDKYTFTYTASVDVRKITGNGTAAQTENDISVKSDENPDPVTDTTDLEGEIPYTKISKDVATESDATSDNKVLIKWTVTYGDKDNAASLGGITLTDKLQWETDRNSYDIEGHDGITVQENDGTPYTVSWADVHVTTGNEDSWSWTIPEGAAGNTEYTITYYTVFDKTDQVIAVYPKNTISDGQGHSAEKGIGIGSKDMRIVKQLTSLDFDNKTASWTITITVPASGLKTAYLNDYYPHKTINGNDYYDTLQDNSVTVSGLLDGESYTLDSSNVDHFRIDFSSNYTENGITYDLKPSTEERTITVTLKTDMNQGWIEAANDSENSEDRYHANTAGFHGNGQTVTSQDRYFTSSGAIDKTVGNNGNPVGYYTSDGDYYQVSTSSDAARSDTDLPIWRFRIALNGVNGDINITDQFDTDLFMIDTTNGADNLVVHGVTSWNWRHSNTDINGHLSMATVATASDGAKLSVSQDRLPKDDNNPVRYYETYYFDYFLRVKSQEALQKLRQICAEQGTGLKATLTNVVSRDGNTDTANFYYTYEGVKKEIVNNGYVDPDDGYTYADFKIVLNPTGADLDADADTLQASDTWSDSLAIKPDSFVFKDASGNDISSSVSYDITGRTANFTIPDATAVTVTYRARVLGTGTIDYSNTATLNGYIAGKSAVATVNSSAAGSGSIFTIHLLKYAEGNINQPLGGAVFSLYRLDDSGNKVPVRDNNGDIASFTTDNSGKARVFGSQANDGWTLYENVQYYLHEETAPAGFKRLSEDYAFQVSQTSQDWENHLYINGDTILIPNESKNEEETELTFTFTKVWSDHNNSDGVRPSSDPQSEDFFGNWLHLYQTVDGTTTEVTGYTPTITVDPSDSSRWTVSYTGLPSIDGSYSVKEVIPEGSSYLADYESEVIAAVTDEGTLTNTYSSSTVSVPVQKKWADGAAGTKAVIVLTANGTKTDRSIELNEGNGWKSTFEELPKYDGDDNEIAYGVTEETEDWNYTVESDGEGGFIVTNHPKDDENVPDNPNGGNDNPNGGNDNPNGGNNPGGSDDNGGGNGGSHSGNSSGNPRNNNDSGDDETETGQYSVEPNEENALLAPNSPEAQGNSLPRTGDSSHTGMFVFLFVAALIGLVSILVIKKNKNA